MLILKIISILWVVFLFPIASSAKLTPAQFLKSPACTATGARLECTNAANVTITTEDGPATIDVSLKLQSSDYPTLLVDGVAFIAAAGMYEQNNTVDSTTVHFFAPRSAQVRAFMKRANDHDHICESGSIITIDGLVLDESLATNTPTASTQLLSSVQLSTGALLQLRNSAVITSCKALRLHQEAFCKSPSSNVQVTTTRAWGPWLAPCNHCYCCQACLHGVHAMHQAILVMVLCAVCHGACALGCDNTIPYPLQGSA